MKPRVLHVINSAVGALLLVSCLDAFAATWTSDTHTLAPGDFNNDGRADLLVIAKDASQPSGIALNDGSQPNVFHQSWASNYLGITWSGGTYVPLIGDFNGDNYDDIFLQRTSGGNHYVLLNDGTGQFTQIHQSISNSHLGVNWSQAERRIVVGNFNNSGGDDLFLQANATNVDNVVALSSISSTPFLSVSPPTPWPNAHVSLEWSLFKAIDHAGDFNADGYADWFVQAKPNWTLIPFDDLSIPVPTYRPSSYGIALADGTGRAATLAQAWNHDYLGFEWSPLQYDAFVANFGGDQCADILLQAKTPGNATRMIISQCGAQPFASPTVHVLSAGYNWDQTNYQLRIGDFNGDGRADIYMQALAGGTNRIALTDSNGNVTTVSAHTPSGNFKKPVPGAIPGSYATGNQGEGTYAIPIVAPAATGGMKPNLALTYNHLAGNGLAGMRWTLSGVSAITRCQQTYGQDNVNVPITYTSSDRFCLDGRRLVNVSGAYGADGTEYRTEIDTFQRIVQYGGLQGGGPASFRVDHGNGLSSYFGATPDSFVEAPGGSAARIWYIAYTEDRFGNQTTYTYDENPSTKETVPTEVAWTKRSGLTPKYKIAISFEARPPDDQRFGYDSAGKTWAATKRIDKIDVLYSGQLINSYDLSYATAATTGTGRSQLQRVDLCGPTECLGPTSLGVQSGTRGWQAAVDTGQPAGTSQLIGDVNRDGRKDIVAVGASSTWQVYFGNADGTVAAPLNTGVSAGPNPATARIVDFNGDGRSDVLYKASAGVWRVLFYNGTSFAEWSSTISTSNPTHANIRDVDGDGIGDWVYRDGSYIKWRRNSGVYDPPITQPFCCANTLAAVNGFSLFYEDPNAPADFNGDGKHDLINLDEYCETWPDIGTVCTPVWNILVSTGTAYNVMTTLMGGLYDDLGSVRAIDINGDGLDDLVYTYGGQWYTQLSTGTGFANAVATGIGWASGQGGFVTDFDNDGREDLIITAGDNWLVQRSTGSTVAASSVYSISGLTGTSAAFFADVSGDGFPELLRAQGGTWRAHKHQTALPDVATTFTDGLGYSVSVQYQSIANSPNYSFSSSVIVAPPYVQPLAKARYVVTAESRDDGIAGTRDFTHYYETAFMDVSGRNWSSFERHRVNDVDRGTYNIRYFEQFFPLFGMVKKDELHRSSDGQVIREVAQNLLGPGTGAPARWFPRVESRTIKEYEVGGVANNTLLRTIVEDPTYSESFGYVTTISRTTTDPAVPANQWTSTTTFNRTEYQTPWCLGLPGLVTTTNGAPGQSQQTRQIRYVFNPSNCSLSNTTDESDQASQAKQLKTTYGYDAYGNVLTVTQDSADGSAPDRSTTFGYDSAGQFPLSMTVGGVNLVTEFTWNPFFGQRETVKAPDLLTTRWDYDNFGRVLKETRPVGSSTVSFDDCNGCWPQYARFSVRTHGSDGTDSYEYFDEAQRPVGESWTLPQGQQGRRETRYNGTGQVSQASQPYLSGDPIFWVSYQYDLIGRATQHNAPLSESQPSGAITSVEYRGPEVWTTDPKTHQTKYAYNAAGQISQVVDAVNATTAYTYLPFGELRTVVNQVGTPDQTTTTIGYDARGFKSSMADPNMGSWNYEYNVYGELEKQKSPVTTSSPWCPGPSVWTVCIVYDTAGRLTSRQEYEGTTSFTYHTSGAGAIGKPNTISTSNYVEAYTYSPTNGLPTHVGRTLDGSSYDFDMTFDGEGRIDVLSYPDISGYRFKVDYDYDVSGSLVAAKDGNTGSLYYALSQTDALGRYSYVTLGNGLNERRTYDRASGYLREIDTGPLETSTVQDLSFTWDEVGNLQSRQNHLIVNTTETMTYDALDRLTQSQVSGGPAAVTISYSTSGRVTPRITSKSDCGAYTYGDAAHPDAVTSACGASYSYDASGRMATHGADTFTWYSYDLPKLLAVGTKTAEFFYGAGRGRYKQIQKTGSTTNATIYYVGALFEKEIPQSGSPIYRHHVTSGEHVIATVSRVGTTNTVQYLHRDHQESVVEVTNGTGGLLQSLAYDPWGLRRNAATWAPLPSPFAGSQPTERGYTGHEHLDSVELIHMNGRVQDPRLGRFISADPIIQAPYRSQSFDRYSYVWNNPTSRLDPSGFQSDEDTPQPPPSTPNVDYSYLLPEICLGNHPMCDDRYANYDPETQRAVNCANGRGPCDMYADDGAALPTFGQAANGDGNMAVGQISGAGSAVTTHAGQPDLPNTTTMESRRRGERGWTHSPENETKGVQPIRDKDGKIIGWKTKTADGKGSNKTLEWGRQKGLDPATWDKQKSLQTNDAPDVGPTDGPEVGAIDGPSVGSVVGGILAVGLVVGAVICAAAEPCGAAVAAGLAIGGGAILAN